METEAPRPLRADAARNHRRILDAAAAVFEHGGPESSLEEIAARAGVGVATLYRRFHSREQLVRAVFEDVFSAEIEPTAWPPSDDPWADLAGALSRALDAISSRQVILGLARETSAYDVQTVHRYGRALERLLDRAREAGLVRPELTVRDLSAVLVMVMATVHRDDPAGDDRRRYLALVLGGLRPGRDRLPAGSPARSAADTA